MTIVVPNKILLEYKSGYEPPLSYANDNIWNKDATYGDDTVVRDIYKTSYDDSSDSDYYMWYLCLKDGTTGADNIPHRNRFLYSPIIPDNKTALLDKYINTKTASLENKPLRFSITAGFVDTIILLNVEARYCILDYLDSDDNTVAITIDLAEIDPFWGSDDYPPILNQKEAIFRIGKVTNNVVFNITITNNTATTSNDYVYIGKILAGRGITIGETELPISSNLMTTSTREVDGEKAYYNKKQNTYKEISYKVQIKDVLRGVVNRLFENLDMKDCYFAPDIDGWDKTINNFGFYNNFELIAEDGINSTYGFTVEGTI